MYVMRSLFAVLQTTVIFFCREICMSRFLSLLTVNYRAEPSRQKELYIHTCISHVAGRRDILSSCTYL